MTCRYLFALFAMTVWVRCTAVGDGRYRRHGALTALRLGGILG
jgi:hypothetical protein